MVFRNPYQRVPRSWRVSASATVLKIGDEASQSRPAGAGFKPLHAAAFKRRGGERWRRGGARRRQVSVEKMSASEPLTTHRNGFRRCQNGREVGSGRTSMDDTCLRSCGSRGIGGMISSQASIWNEGTWHGVPREKVIAHPQDSRLHHKALKVLVRQAKRAGIRLRQLV